MIVDFHTHAFPDNVAAKAIPALTDAGKISAYTSGTVDSLLVSMDRAGIDISLICSIATRAEQFSSILDWSRKIRSERLIPLPSIHPEDNDIAGKIKLIKQEGFIGIKMHPFYQNFYLDDPRLFPLYHDLSKAGLLLVIHCGYDIAFPRERRVDPVRILKIRTQFPDLKLITTHLGGWDIWDEVEKILIGRDIYMEISFSLKYLPEEQVVRMLKNHPADYLLFGTDSPWDDQLSAVKRLKALGLTEILSEKILGKNAMHLL